MNQEQRQFAEMNERTAVRVAVPPSMLLMIIFGEIFWLGLMIYGAVHHAFHPAVAFVLIVVSLVIPATICSRVKKNF